mmetsp:Transcript_73586/g.163553  ORF Transcript_73586/g.163553 Transcript_73586/m.163553 type:complete len:80 (+) Transcript_73586:288-527(+)
MASRRGMMVEKLKPILLRERKVNRLSMFPLWRKKTRKSSSRGEDVEETMASGIVSTRHKSEGCVLPEGNWVELTLRRHT